MKASSLIAVEVLAAYKIGSNSEFETFCDDYDQYKALPSAVTFEGRVYGKKGWNSDRGRAYYGTDKLVAMPIAGAAVL